jgi:hypothetical protein
MSDKNSWKCPLCSCDCNEFTVRRVNEFGLTVCCVCGTDADVYALCYPCTGSSSTVPKQEATPSPVEDLPQVVIKKTAKKKKKRPKKEEPAPPRVTVLKAASLNVKEKATAETLGQLVRGRKTPIKLKTHEAAEIYLNQLKAEERKLAMQLENLEALNKHKEEVKLKVNLKVKEPLTKNEFIHHQTNRIKRKKAEVLGEDPSSIQELLYRKDVTFSEDEEKRDKVPRKKRRSDQAPLSAVIPTLPRAEDSTSPYRQVLLEEAQIYSLSPTNPAASSLSLQQTHQMTQQSRAALAALAHATSSASSVRNKRLLPTRVLPVQPQTTCSDFSQDQQGLALAQVPSVASLAPAYSYTTSPQQNQQMSPPTSQSETTSSLHPLQGHEMTSIIRHQHELIQRQSLDILRNELRKEEERVAMQLQCQQTIPQRQLDLMRNQLLKEELRIALRIEQRQPEQVSIIAPNTQPNPHDLLSEILQRRQKLENMNISGKQEQQQNDDLLFNIRARRQELEHHAKRMNGNEANQSLELASRRLASLESQEKVKRCKAPTHVPPNGGDQPFPVNFYDLVTAAEQEGKSDIVSFAHDGNVVCVHKKKEFMATLVPRYFRQKLYYKSFQRQFRFHGFTSTEKGAHGKEREYFQHEFFKKGRRDLVYQIKRRDLWACNGDSA